MMPPACWPGQRCPVSEVLDERPDNFCRAPPLHQIARLLREHLRAERLLCAGMGRADHQVLFLSLQDDLWGEGRAPDQPASGFSM